jgi:hypothetical protein
MGSVTRGHLMGAALIRAGAVARWDSAERPAAGKGAGLSLEAIAERPDTQGTEAITAKHGAGIVTRRLHAIRRLLWSMPTPFITC